MFANDNGNSGNRQLLTSSPEQRVSPDDELANGGISANDPNLHLLQDTANILLAGGGLNLGPSSSGNSSGNNSSGLNSSSTSSSLLPQGIGLLSSLSLEQQQEINAGELQVAIHEDQEFQKSISMQDLDEYCFKSVNKVMAGMIGFYFQAHLSSSKGSTLKLEISVTLKLKMSVSTIP